MRNQKQETRERDICSVGAGPDSHTDDAPAVGGAGVWGVKCAAQTQYNISYAAFALFSLEGMSIVRLGNPEPAGCRVYPAAGISVAAMLLVAALVPPLSAQESTPHEAARRLALAAMERDRLPSLSVAVARDGKVLFAEAYGFSDVGNSVPATAQSVYRIGSISKTLTAVAVMILAENGELDLDAPIQKYCPAFPSKEFPITARLLLAHQGGVRGYNYQRFREEFLSTRRYESLADALSIFKGDPLVAKPGTKYHYSSFGYVLLGCAVEGASGVSFEDVLRRRVLQPGGMVQTTLDYSGRIVPHRVHGYGKAADGSWTNAVYVDLSDRFPAGGLLSTPRDLVAFGSALIAGKLVSPATLQTMWEAQHTVEGQATQYGLGWRVSNEQNEVFHGGASVGGSAYVYVRPDKNLVVAFATNMELWTEPRHELARRLAEAVEE